MRLGEGCHMIRSSGKSLRSLSAIRSRSHTSLNVTEKECVTVRVFMEDCTKTDKEDREGGGLGMDISSCFAAFANL